MKKFKYLKFFVFLLLMFIIIFNYKPDEQAKKLLNEVEIRNKNIYILSDKSDKLIVFYPGAKVDPVSYIPLLYNINKYNIDVIIVKMPFNLAIFGKNKAKDIIEENKVKYNKIYMMGHSLGGAMASEYAFNNSKEISGLILIGAYPYKPYDYNNTISIYGNIGKIENRNKIKNEKINNLLKIEIDGANHANYGNYGNQYGDSKAIILRDEQQKIVIENVVKFINKK